MTDNESSVQSKERRLKPRWKIPKSLDAKVMLWHQQDAGEGRYNTSEQCYQGFLSNFCECGVQVIVGIDFWEHLHPNQSIKLQLHVCSGETDAEIELLGQAKYIVPDYQEDKMKLGIQFSKSELSDENKRLISQVFDFSGFCTECNFDECPNL